MIYIRLTKIGLALFLLMPYLSFADGGYGYYNRDNLRGTYIAVQSQICSRGAEATLGRTEVDSTAEFTLDGKGNYVSRNDYVFLNGPGSVLGQSSDLCKGRYKVERVNHSTVVNVPELVCVGKTTAGTQGATPEAEPLMYFNYEVVVRNLSFKFQRGRKAGVFSDVPPEGVPVVVENFILTDFPEFSTDRRCSRIGTFFNKGKFSVLTAPEPAPVQQ